MAYLVLQEQDDHIAESMEVGPVQTFVAPSSPVLRMVSVLGVYVFVLCMYVCGLFIYLLTSFFFCYQVRSRSLTPTSPSGGRTHYSW